MLQTLSYHCTALYRSFTDYTSRRLQEIGMSYGALFVIIYIGKHPGCTQGELTQALRLDWGYCQRTIVRLVEDGFLTRERVGRAYHLDLREKGQQAFAISHQVFFDWDDQVMAGLSIQEREQLIKLLNKVTCQEGTSPLCTIQS